MSPPATAEDSRRARSGRIGLIAILVLVPLAVGAIILGLRLFSSGRARAYESAEWTALQRWPSGQPRVLFREAAHQAGADEQCFFAADGAELGCGTSRDGKPWDGTFVDWQPDTAGRDALVLKELRSFREGRPDGVWRSFQPDGSPAVESTYKAGALVSREAVRNGEKVVLRAQPPPPPDVPVNRRTNPTYVP